MNAQQLHDYIIRPTLDYMGGHYNSESARLLLLGTAAIESDCGYYIKQVKGPALGIWQMEPATHDDLWVNCDAICHSGKLSNRIEDLSGKFALDDETLIQYPVYACAMARLKYSMTPTPLPVITGKRLIDEKSFYDYYAKYYHGQNASGKELGKSTFLKWQIKCEKHNIFEVNL